MDYIHFENIESTNNYAKTISNKKDCLVLHQVAFGAGNAHRASLW